jgi:hypothetical protein
MKDEQSHTRGLVAVEESRLRRKLGSFPQIPPRFLLWTVTVLIAWGIFYWRKNESEIESQKAALFARQRGVAAELGRASTFNVNASKIGSWPLQVPTRVTSFLPSSRRSISARYRGCTCGCG